MLHVEDLTVRYGDLTIVDHLNFAVEEGQWLMIVGPNGAGKSTALNAIAQGTAYTGRVMFEGGEMKKKKSSDRARCVGVLMQNHFVEYAFSVEEVAALGRYAHSAGARRNTGKGAGRGGEDSRAVEDALALTGMISQRRQSILTLSGGELQRTFLAQVFAQDPKLLLLDEPTNHLDLVYQKQVFELIGKWLQTPGRAVISVVHDLSLAKAYGTKILLMNHGREVACGPAAEVLVPEHLDPVYQMDVGGWMRQMLGQWNG